MSTATVVRGNCISDSMPSCIRAPPDAGNITERALLSNRALESLHDRFPGRNPERTAHEVELVHDCNEPDTFDVPEPGNDRIFLLGFQPAVPQSVCVFLRIAEFQRILGHLWLGECFILTAIEEIEKPGLSRHLHVIAGSRNHPFILLEVLVKDHLAGFGALDPEVLRHLTAAKHGIDPRPHVVGNPVQLTNS